MKHNYYQNWINPIVAAAVLGEVVMPVFLASERHVWDGHADHGPAEHVEPQSSPGTATFYWVRMPDWG